MQEFSQDDHNCSLQPLEVLKKTKQNKLPYVGKAELFLNFGLSFCFPQVLFLPEITTSLTELI